MLTRGDVVEKNKTRFFYVLYSDEISPVYDQSERAQGLIYIIISDKNETYIKTFASLKITRSQCLAVELKSNKNI